MGTRTIALTVAAVVVVAGVTGVVLYLNRSTAEVASIDNALQAVATATEDAATEDAATGDAATEDADASGTWVVTTEVGEFDFADATATFVGFRVDEELANVGQTEAIGRTPAVDGELVIEGTTLTAATIEADLTQMVSDIPRREGAMRRAMGVDANPTGTFTLIEPVDVGAVPAEGEVLTATAVGELTVNGVTNAVEVPLEVTAADGDLLVVGSMPVVFADHDVTAPQAGPVVSIEQEGTVELQLWFTRP